MNTQTENKLNMYKAVETVCALNHTEWNTQPRFGSAFSRFSVKVAQLDLLSDEQSGQSRERIMKLMHEIDQLLRNSIDGLVKFMRQEHSDFYSMYVSARTRL
jgi:hypothetical protein